MSVEGWKTGKLRDITVINYGKSPVKILSPEGQYPVVGTGENERLGTNFLYDGESIILGRKGSIDRVYFASGKFWAIDTAYYLSDFRETFPRWLFYYLQTIDLRQMNEATGVPSLSREFLYNIALQIPAKAEQTQIATILSTIDRAIEQTEALIAKQQRIKTGLMQDLLTKGIDENGNIRSEETHEFKDSPLGRIPVEWEVSQLRDTGTWLSGGTPSKSEKTYWGPFVPWVCSKDMKVFDLKNTLEMITQKGVLSGSKVAPKDSVLIVVRGMILAHTFPVVYLTRDMAFNQDIKAIIPNENIYGRYLAYWFSANSSQLLKLTTTATHGTKRLETNDLLEFALCLPSKMEQKKIIYLLDKSQYDIEITKEYLQKLKLQKTGLMQDLLTGKVRVTDLLNQKAAVN